MKNYDETVDTVFDRIRDYNVKKKRRTVLACRITAACCAVTLLGGSVWYLNRPTHDIPVTLAPDKNEVTTTAAPTEGEATATTTTTVNTTAGTTTDGGIVTPPTTTVPAPSKIEPPKTTATTTAVKDKLVITADEPDDEVLDSSNGKRISSALQQKMELYKGADVSYAVIAVISITQEDRDKGWWSLNEEVAQFHEEYQRIDAAFYEEAKRLNPDYSPHDKDEDIKVWTDTMRANKEYLNANTDKFLALYYQYYPAFNNIILERRSEELKKVCDMDPIDVLSELNFPSNSYRAYYVELTAEAINALAEQGGYTFTLARYVDEVWDD